MPSRHLWQTIMENAAIREEPGRFGLGKREMGWGRMSCSKWWRLIDFTFFSGKVSRDIGKEEEEGSPRGIDPWFGANGSTWRVPGTRSSPSSQGRIYFPFPCSPAVEQPEFHRKSGSWEQPFRTFLRWDLSSGSGERPCPRTSFGIPSSRAIPVSWSRGKPFPPPCFACPAPLQHNNSRQSPAALAPLPPQDNPQLSRHPRDAVPAGFPLVPPVSR